MTANGIVQIVVFIAAVLLLAKPLGAYMARVYENKKLFLDPLLSPIERVIYRLAGVKSNEEMNWKTYAGAMLLFNFAGVLAVYLIQRTQQWLPLNPAAMTAVSPDSSFNTAVSFATNTNWQGYGGESTMSYLTQMLALTVQNFVSAAAGMAVMVALIRGIARKTTTGIGNFWVDLIRTTLYILLPLALVFSLFFVSQGVTQTFNHYPVAKVVQPSNYDAPVLDKEGNPVKDDKGVAKIQKTQVTEQTIAVGPVASQLAIKQLGTNGGGFFNANSAHPFENPTPLSNFFEMLAILLIPASLCYTLGKMVGDTRQGWAILITMTLLWAGFLMVCVIAEQHGNPLLTKLGVDQIAQDIKPLTTHSGGNMEGKEVRFGIVDSAIFATSTTGTSCGAVNAMHDSFTPLGGLVPLMLIQIGEVVFGGVGTGIYGMLMFVIVTVFISGLMVGRTPEYLGKKIEAHEMKMASIGILIPCATILVGTGIAVLLPQGVAAVANPGPHGLSEILYAFSSCANNNGSAFAGISVNTPFYNLTLGLAMLLGRYWVKIAALAIAGSLVAKKVVPIGAGTLPTHTPLFVATLISIIIIVAALTFIPALALGPIVEHLLMLAQAAS